MAREEVQEARRESQESRPAEPRRGRGRRQSGRAFLASLGRVSTLPSICRCVSCSGFYTDCCALPSRHSCLPLSCITAPATLAGFCGTWSTSCCVALLSAWSASPGRGQPDFFFKLCAGTSDRRVLAHKHHVTLDRPARVLVENYRRRADDQTITFQTKHPDYLALHFRVFGNVDCRNHSSRTVEPDNSGIGRSLVIHPGTLGVVDRWLAVFPSEHKGNTAARLKDHSTFGLWSPRLRCLSGIDKRRHRGQQPPTAHQLCQLGIHNGTHQIQSFILVTGCGRCTFIPERMSTSSAPAAPLTSLLQGVSRYPTCPSGQLAQLSRSFPGPIQRRPYPPRRAAR